MKERLFEYRLVRYVVSWVLLFRGGLRLLLRRSYGAVSDLCWLVRVPELGLFRWIGAPLVRSMATEMVDSGENAIAHAFLSDPTSAEARQRWSAARGCGDLRLFGNLIVLKSRTMREKGVLLLKYTPTFDLFMASFDVRSIAQHYYIVLEPSWAGYCDPSILMYGLRDQPVIVQCFTDEDSSFIENLKTGLKPLRLGPADWVAPEAFQEEPRAVRKYDLVMLASWAPFKQHRILFRALRRIHQPLRVLLIGYPWGGRTRANIEADARGVGRHISIEIEERLPYAEVVDRLMDSKALVFLSKKEGDNKALVEGLFAGVPAIVYERSVGGARSRINKHTGLLTSYRDLPDTILRVVRDWRSFSPRSWAHANTGSSRATATLETFVREVAQRRGESFVTGIVEKSNSPNLTYRGGASREMFEDDYQFLNAWRRES